MRVQAARGHRDRRRHDQVPRRLRRAGHDGPAPVPQERPGGQQHAVARQAGRARHRARRRRRQPGRPAAAVDEHDAGRPRPVRHRPQRRRPAQLRLQLLQDHAAARRPRPEHRARPDQRRRAADGAGAAGQHPARGELQRRELLPGREGERRPRDHAGRVQRAHGRDREGDQGPPRRAGRGRRPGGRGVRRRRQRPHRPGGGARQLHAATSRPTTTAAGSRPASWSRTARRPPTAG